jgi:low affinity Fe/Cu permease
LVSLRTSGRCIGASQRETNDSYCKDDDLSHRAILSGSRINATWVARVPGFMAHRRCAVVAPQQPRDCTSRAMELPPTIAVATKMAKKPIDKPAAQTDWFDAFARKTALLCGKPVVFLAAVLIVLVWAFTGPLFGFTDTWQLVINTGTTIVTFLMVFLIQNTQNRDSLAVQIKLSELILAVKGAKNRLASAEDLSESELEELHKEYCARAEEAVKALEKRRAGKKPRLVK